MLFANCHNHSTFSDGVFSPEELIDLAKKIGHEAVILTDHDTVRGTYFLQRAARREGLLSLLGCEFGTVAPGGENVHLLGLDFNPDNKKMQELLAYTSGRQTTRSHLMFEFGLERGTLREGLTWQEVLDDHPYNDYFCNNQVFASMVKRGIYREEEYADFYHGSFDASRSGGNLALRETLKEKLQHYPAPAMVDVIGIIKEAGGVPVVAHPQGFCDKAEAWVRLGVCGFEVIHPDCDADTQAFFAKFCEEHHLYALGGTDHSSLMGGFYTTMPNHDLPPSCGYTTKEHFMQLYRRTLG